MPKAGRPSDPLTSCTTTTYTHKFWHLVLYIAQNTLYNGDMRKENRTTNSFHIIHSMSGDQTFTGTLQECQTRYQEILDCQGPRAVLHWYILDPRTNQAVSK